MATWPQVQVGSILTQGANYVTKTTAYSAADSDFVLANATGGAFTVTLPPVVDGALVGVKKTDSSGNAVTLKTSDSSTIDGIAGSTGVACSAQYSTVVVVSDGVAWHVVSSYLTASTPGVNGWNFKAKTTTYTAVAGDFVQDTPSGAHTISLPTPALAGQAVAVKNLTGAHTITVATTDSTTIDGITGATGVLLAAEYDTVVVVFDGTNWNVQSGGPAVTAA